MNAGTQTTRRLAHKAAATAICPHSVSRSAYATAAAAQAEGTQQHSPPVAACAQSYAVNAGVVLSRPPQITRDLHPFESAFFLYQRRLNERLALPFTRYFYVKKKTPADLEWKRKMKTRLTPARDIGNYRGYGDEAWNDELLVGAPESEFQYQVEKLLEDTEMPPVEGEGEGEAGAVGGEEGLMTAATGAPGKKVEHEPAEKPSPRITEADLKADVKSLNRLLPRTLYLLVQNKNGQWMFPQSEVDQRETLHMAAERVLIHSGGINMNTWVVGNQPIGHYQHNFAAEALKAAQTPNEVGFKTFFMKARIMAGQADLEANTLGLADFKWLAKEEVEKTVDGKYWRSIKNMLAER